MYLTSFNSNNAYKINVTFVSLLNTIYFSEGYSAICLTMQSELFRLTLNSVYSPGWPLNWWESFCLSLPSVSITGFANAYYIHYCHITVCGLTPYNDNLLFHNSVGQKYRWQTLWEAEAGGMRPYAQPRHLVTSCLKF